MKTWGFLLLCLLCIKVPAQNFETDFERSNGRRSATYEALIPFYQRLDEKYATIKMEEAGSTDSYYPLHVVYYSKDGKFDVNAWKADNKLVVLINNGIHPGEPDGIDASMMLLRDAAMGKVNIPDNVILAVIPVFNIGGMLNRGRYSRANQNGPEEYGFRGNGENLDLNRDFIKMDALETQSLVKLFHQLNPDLFIDNHVSDGADYQHIMTLLSTQHNKLGDAMGDYLNKVLEPMIYLEMYKDGYNMVPYVNHFGNTPESGWTAFYEGPRFASGMAAMFHTYAFVPETHMLKAYQKRVDATYELMRLMIKVAGRNADDIKRTRKETKSNYRKAECVPVAWEPDKAKATTVNFNGFQSEYKPSDVSGKPRLYYDRNKPYTKEVPVCNTYKQKQTVIVPKAYVLPRGWHKVIRRLELNGVKMKELTQDSIISVVAYYIDSFSTTPNPYEGHYLHSNIKVHQKTMNLLFRKGDYIIPADQPAKRFVIEVLEPAAPDSYFAWGFFDAVLQHKGGYSDYVFEDDAAGLLKKDADLRRLLDDKRKADTAFANNGDAQLEFVYRHSVYNEAEYMRYPVYRLE